MKLHFFVDFLTSVKLKKVPALTHDGHAYSSAIYFFIRIADEHLACLQHTCLGANIFLYLFCIMYLNAEIGLDKTKDNCYVCTMSVVFVLSNKIIFEARLRLVTIR